MDSNAHWNKAFQKPFLLPLLIPFDFNKRFHLYLPLEVIVERGLTKLNILEFQWNQIRFWNAEETFFKLKFL